MKTVFIRLRTAEEIKTFVQLVNGYPYRMDLRATRQVIDAKSILGIFSMDLSRQLRLEIYAKECADLLRDIRSFLD